MTLKHTPGPWLMAAPKDYDSDGIGVMAKNKYGVHYYVARAGYMGSADPDYAEANARLISAAPDLLAALQNILDYERDSIPDAGTYGREVYDAARAVISKATGE
jgi:hypothetical protein